MKKKYLPEKEINTTGFSSCFDIFSIIRIYFEVGYRAWDEINKSNVEGLKYKESLLY